MLERAANISVQKWTLINVVVGAGLWGLLLAASRLSIDSNLVLALFGLGLPLLPSILQYGTGPLLYRAGYKRYARFSPIEFLRLCGGNLLLLTAPPGLALAMIGVGAHVIAYHGELELWQELSYLLGLVLIGTLFAGTWKVLKELRIPGYLIAFANPAREADVRALARQIGAPLRALKVCRTRSGRIAGAYSLGGGDVAITDGMLAALNRDEFLSVMAHELRHLTQTRETVRILLLGFATTLFLGFAVGTAISWLGIAELAPIAVGLTVLALAICFRILVNMKRRHEDEADETASKTVGAYPLMTALAKAAIINGADPMVSSVRYRSIRTRLDRLAKLAGLAPQAAENALLKAQVDLELIATLAATPRSELHGSRVASGATG